VRGDREAGRPLAGHLEPQDSRLPEHTNHRCNQFYSILITSLPIQDLERGVGDATPGLDIRQGETSLRNLSKTKTSRELEELDDRVATRERHTIVRLGLTSLNGRYHRRETWLKMRKMKRSTMGLLEVECLVCCINFRRRKRMVDQVSIFEGMGAFLRSFGEQGIRHCLGGCIEAHITVD